MIRGQGSRANVATEGEFEGDGEASEAEVVDADTTPWSRTRRRAAKSPDGALARNAYSIHGRPSASLSLAPNIRGKPIGGGSMINSTKAFA
jgi:hypothetical protein